MQEQGQDMASVAINQMHLWEQKYYDITELYALNEELLLTVEQSANPEAQLELVAPLIETIGESTDLLSEEYISLCEGSSANRTKSKSKIEGSLRKVYVAIGSFNKKARDTKNAAHFIVKKIKRQLEQVIANFIEFVALSLGRIMQKHDVDELNAHHASIALMLYQHGQGS
jgi:hypothetical protein